MVIALHCSKRHASNFPLFFSLLAGKPQPETRSIPDRLSGGGQALEPGAGLL
jgi:hypothetical protein